MRIFIDANVLFSASNAGSGLSVLLSDLREECELVITSYVYDEVVRNLASKKPNWLPHLVEHMAHIHFVKNISGESAAQYINHKDAPVLAAAIETKCNYLISGDKKAFGALNGKKIKDTRILLVSDFAERYYTKSLDF
jgi:predicted nucleic acid-binding protein